MMDLQASDVNLPRDEPSGAEQAGASEHDIYSFHMIMKAVS